MPYGKAYRTRRGMRTTRTSTRRKSTLARQKTARYAKVSTARLAKRAYTLAKRNRVSLYGSYQQNLQHFRQGLTFDAASPVCFHIMTPSVNEPVYQFLPVAGSTAYTVQTPTEFLHPSLLQLTGAYGGTGDEAYSQWTQANDDAINGKYRLLTSKYTFRVKMRNAPGAECRIRIDFVKPNWNRIFRVLYGAGATVEENKFLPDCLGSFNSLLGPNNEINFMYFKQTRKPIYMRCAPGNNLTTAEIQKTVFMRHNKVLNPVDDEPAFAPYTKISIKNQEWCIVSTDSETTSQVKPEVNVTRIVAWRDMRGHAA